jgi:hypothetical protein
LMASLILMVALDRTCVLHSDVIFFALLLRQAFLLGQLLMIGIHLPLLMC